MEQRDVLRKSLRGSAVVGGAMLAQHGLAFVAQLALARLLAPEHFGALAFASMVVMLFYNFTHTQGDRYIITEKDGVREKLSGVFTLEILSATGFFVLVFLTAPLLMKLLGRPELALYVRFLAVQFFYNPFSKVRVLYERELSFFRSKAPMVAGQIAGSTVAVLLAWQGYGVWSLLWYRVCVAAVEAGLLWIIAPYRPRLAWQWPELRGILRFTLPLVGSSVFAFAIYNADYFVVGRILGDRELGFYWMAFQLTHYIIKFRSVVISVGLPAFTRLGSDERLARAFTVLSSTTALVLVFPTILFIVFGSEVITLILGAKWLPSAMAFKVLMPLILIRGTISYWEPVQLAKGNTWVQFVVTALGAVTIPLFVYLLATRYGIAGAALGVLLAGLIEFALEAVLNQKFVMRLDYRRHLGILAVFGPLCLALLAGRYWLELPLLPLCGGFVLTYSILAWKLLPEELRTLALSWIRARQTRQDPVAAADLLQKIHTS